ncbi:hypothetical protein SPLC1_S530020 [Arthrospira platensis C1]|uniref:Uncharacterized protein n=1 Tax=Limnospira indica PCC 8005 TaxID=376219 RepID=A0A9P1KF09_9CYAN|nr:hypothetical protein SPLC1_S530020 [Arthrospira platensis C1]CDM95533.1 conserved protein of unknown function [Limnospira indica PCC 8005]
MKKQWFEVRITCHSHKLSQSINQWLEGEYLYLLIGVDFRGFELN